jgi:hypothetical protein
VTTFLRALMNGSVVRQPRLDQMGVVDPITIDDGDGFGPGLETLPHACANYGKNGSMPGYMNLPGAVGATDRTSLLRFGAK